MEATVLEGQEAVMMVLEIEVILEGIGLVSAGQALLEVQETLVAQAALEVRAALAAQEEPNAVVRSGRETGTIQSRTRWSPAWIG